MSIVWLKVLCLVYFAIMVIAVIEKNWGMACYMGGAWIINVGVILLDMGY